jgi:hypothetical protein
VQQREGGRGEVGVVEGNGDVVGAARAGDGRVDVGREEDNGEGAGSSLRRLREHTMSERAAYQGTPRDASPDFKLSARVLGGLRACAGTGDCDPYPYPSYPYP